MAQKHVVHTVVTDGTMQANELDGTQVKSMSLTDVAPGVVLGFFFRNVTNATNTQAKKIPAGKKFSVIGVQGYKTAGNGGAGDTLDILNGATTMLDAAIDLHINDKLKIVNTGIDDAACLLDGDNGDTLNATWTKATDCRGDVVVMAVCLA